MSYRRVHDPISERYQANRFNGYPATTGWPYYLPLDHDEGPRRSAPAEMPFKEHDPIFGGWWQGQRKLRDFRPNKYWARPVDGKRRGARGRLMDGLTGKGPDVFVVFNGDRRTLHRDMPHRAQWSGWNGLWDVNLGSESYDPDATAGEYFNFDMPWAKQDQNPYNFRTRKHNRLRISDFAPGSNRVWSDAHWRPNARNSDQNPLTKRNALGQWGTQVPRWAGLYPGGRPVIP